ncbi:MAG TPA: hypothetical protein VKR06_08415 [Ktedonosporobacter sp.]|nr:hypothetical protein [Ktedonosporobacter sp.]
MKQRWLQLTLYIGGTMFVIIIILFCSWSTFMRPSAPTAMDDFPQYYFAPYVQIGLNQWGLTQTARMLKTNFYILASIVDTDQHNCQASWSNAPMAAGQDTLAADIRTLRKGGGDVSVSFGGPTGKELALTCPNVSSLQAQYQQIIDRYSLTHIDFAIEDATLEDSASVDHRNKAIAALQAAAHTQRKTLLVSYTLPVTPSGLEYKGIALLQNARDNGVLLHGINILAMNYGSATLPSQMGKNTIQAAYNVFLQLKSLYPTLSDQQVWGMLGITPMIGHNDVDQEIFTLNDAQQLLSFAQATHLRELSMWSLERDQTQYGADLAATQPYSFTQLFNRFTSGMGNQTGGATISQPTALPTTPPQMPASTITPTSMPSPVPTITPTPTTATPTTATPLPTATAIPSPIPTATAMPTPAPSPIPTATPTPAVPVAATPISQPIGTPSPTLPPPHQ